MLDDVLQAAERFPAGFCGRELFDLAKGSSERFTGTVRVDALFQAPDPYEAHRPSGKEDCKVVDWMEHVSDEQYRSEK